jgi:hypothetical protein
MSPSLSDVEVGDETGEGLELTASRLPITCSDASRRKAETRRDTCELDCRAMGQLNTCSWQAVKIVNAVAEEE